MNFSGYSKAEEASIWQTVFHQPEEKRALLVSNAWSAGYGLNTTDSRVVLRVPYTAAQVQLLEVGVLLLAQQAARLCRSNQMPSLQDQGVTFSVLRSSTFYKYQWVILMVDTAVACPVGKECGCYNAKMCWDRLTTSELTASMSFP